MPGATTLATGGFPDTSVRLHDVCMVDGTGVARRPCVEATRSVLRRRFPGWPRTALVAAMGVGAAAGLAVGAFAIGAAFEGL